MNLSAKSIAEISEVYVLGDIFALVKIDAALSERKEEKDSDLSLLLDLCYKLNKILEDTETKKYASDYNGFIFEAYTKVKSDLFEKIMPPDIANEILDNQTIYTIDELEQLEKSRAIEKHYLIMLANIKSGNDLPLKKAMCEKVLNRLYVDGDIGNIIKNYDYTTVSNIANTVLKDNDIQLAISETVGSCLAEYYDKMKENTEEINVISDEPDITDDM